METQSKTYTTPVNFKRRRVTMLENTTVTAMDDKDNVSSVLLKKGNKYTFSDACKVTHNDVTLLVYTVIDIFGNKYECISDCSEVMDLFLNGELSLY